MNLHSEFLSLFFQELNKEKIIYCVLKNYDKLPEESTRDVDIWVKKEHFKKARKILLKIAESLGWELLKTSYGLNFYKAGGYYFIKDNTCVTIDISPLLHWKGISYMDEDVIAKYIFSHPKGFNITSPGIEAAALIFRGGMMGEIKEKDRPKILEYIKIDKKTFVEVLEKPFGSKIVLSLIDLILAEKWDYIEKNINSLHITILKRALFYRFLQQFKNWCIYYTGRIREHILPSDGFFIVLLGPDGVGKTAIAKALLKSDFIKRLFCKKDYVYRRFTIPWFKKITCMIKNKNIFDFDAHINQEGDIVPLSKVKSVLYILYLGFEFFLGHYFLKRKKANSGLIIFDRYFYDYMTFKDFINCPRWLMFLITKFIPKPDAIIYLKSQPEVIYSRKPERPIKEIKRQVKIYEEIVSYLPNSYTVENSSGIEECINRIQEIIINKLREKKKIKAHKIFCSDYRN